MYILLYIPTPLEEVSGPGVYPAWLRLQSDRRDRALGADQEGNLCSLDTALYLQIHR